MVYLVALLLLMYGVLQYDLQNYQRGKERLFLLIVLYLICVSGLSYRMGGDGIGYMMRYNSYTTYDGIGWQALTKYDGRMPGWVLLVKLCRFITADYCLFKIIHAIIINTLICNAIRGITRYVFSGLLCYFVLLYFDFNFQILRQSLSIALFIYSLIYFKSKQWYKYYICVIIAFLFHESSAVCALFPIMRYFKATKFSLLLISGTIFAIIFFRNNIITTILGGVMPEVFAGKFYAYKQELEESSVFSAFSNLLLSTIIPLLLCYIHRLETSYSVIRIGALVYGISYSVGLIVPIFYRFSLFFIVFFYLLYIELFIDISQKGLSFIKHHTNQSINCFKNNSQRIMYFLLLVLFIIVKSRFYFTLYGDTNYPSWVQYYPYSSVFFENTDETRELFFRQLD